MADINAEELARALTAASIAAADHARALADAEKIVDEYAAAHKKAIDEEAAAAKKLKDALEATSLALGKSVVVFGKALVTGGEGTGKFAGAVDQAADAAGGMATAMLGFGPLGIIVGGVIKAFGSLIGASLKQNDTLMKSYRELSEVGSVSGSLEKLQDDFNKVGLTTEDAAKFGAMLKKVSPDLAGFGGSVTAGKDKLIGVMQGLIGPNNQIELAMGRIGYGAEEMRDATSDYVSKQTRLGLAQGKTTEQLRNESVKYMVSLRELGELTGMSRDEAQKLMDEQQADARWALTLKRIEAEEGKDAAEKARNYMALYSSEFGKQSATDLMEQIANKGAIVGEASARAQQSSNGQAMENFRSVLSGAVQPIQGIIGTANAMDKNLKVLDATLMVAGKGVDSLTGGYQQIGGVLKNAGRTQEEVAARIAEDMKKSGGLLDSNLSAEQKARQFRIIADKTLTDVTGATVSAFEKLTAVVWGLGKSLSTFIDGLTGTGMFGMKATNWSETFRDLGDNASDMKSAAQEKASLLSEIERTTKEIADAEAAAAGSEKNANDLKNQMREKEQLITDLQKDARKITDISLRKEAEAAIAREKLALRELNQQAFNASRSGKLDSSGITEEKKKILLDKQTKLLLEEEKIQKLEKEKLRLEFSTGSTPGSAESGSSGTAAAITSKSAAGSPATRALSTGGPAGGHASEGGSSKDDIPKLSQISSKTGKSTAVNQKFAPAFQGLIDYLDKEGYEINSLGGYVDRDVRGQPGVKSAHANGAAIDINPSTNPMGSQLVTDMPSNISDVAAKLGLGWGGNWKGRKDAMHFSAATNEGGKLHKAMDGGAFTGPNSGYPVELHGKKESVWPEPKLKKLLSEVQKSSIEDYKKELLADLNMKKSSPEVGNASSSSDNGTNKMMEMLTAKFDDMINQFETANGTLSNLLTYAKA